MTRKGRITQTWDKQNMQLDLMGYCSYIYNVYKRNLKVIRPGNKPIELNKWLSTHWQTNDNYAVNNELKRWEK